jgi:hypothetical protein
VIKTFFFMDSTQSDASVDSNQDKHMVNKWLPENMYRFTLLIDRNFLIYTFLLAGLVCLPLGIVLYLSNIQLNSFAFDYTNCDLNTQPSQNINSWSFDKVTKTCTIIFDIPTTFTPNVYMYVAITNMFQNHKLYVKSLNPQQLAGKQFNLASELSSSVTSCAWLQYANCDTAAGIFR